MLRAATASRLLVLASVADAHYILGENCLDEDHRTTDADMAANPPMLFCIYSAFGNLAVPRYKANVMEMRALQSNVAMGNDELFRERCIRRRARLSKNRGLNRRRQT